MDDSWKSGLITAEEMRKANDVIPPEAIALVKDILEVAKKVNEENRKSTSYSLYDSEKFKYLPKVVSMLCELGYDASFDVRLAGAGSYKTYDISISW